MITPCRKRAFQCQILGLTGSTRHTNLDPEFSLLDLYRYRWTDSCECYHHRKVQIRCISRSQGASTGAGLGNAFLAHVRAVDGIFQVVRAFEDADVTHVEGDVDPTRDMSIIQPSYD